MKQSSITSIGKTASVLILTLGLGVGLAGCGFGGVELHGGIFDALGVSGSSSGKSAEPQLARRNALVVPPSTQALPAPGTGQSTGSGVGDPTFQNTQSWPKDPEELKIAKAAHEEKLVAKYCNDRDWWMRSNPEEFSRMTKRGTLCESGMAKMFRKKNRR